jgi:hypothetical protein
MIGAKKCPAIPLGVAGQEPVTVTGLGRKHLMIPGRRGRIPPKGEKNEKSIRIGRIEPVDSGDATP